MPSGPSKTLEAITGLFLPPACREEVLGDLYEKYSGTGQYILLALQVIPCVLVSRIRRTTDGATVLMEALLVYGAYLAAAWYIGQREFRLLALPAFFAVAFMMVADAWSPAAGKSALRLTGEVAMGTLFAFLCMARSLPDALNLFGAGASLLLVSAVRILFRPQLGRHQIAAGPALQNESAALSEITKGLLTAAGVVLVTAALISARFNPAMVGELIFVIIMVIVLQVFNKSRKE
jgi:hypothetical protein